MRTKSILLAGNWKMNHGPKATADFFAALQATPKKNALMRLYVPYLSLDAAKICATQFDFPIEIGAQNIHFEKSGAFTAEVSGPMLTEAGITQVLVGHSERRQYFNETNETVLKRTLSALSQGFEVLVCIGETLNERNANQTQSVLETQLKDLLANEVTKAALGKSLHIAYEPVWAIGTGVTATPSQAEEAHLYIRGLLVQAIGENNANAVRILYGGSVTPQNFKELLSCPNIDGGLVGGASLKAESWSALWDLIS